MNHWHAIILGLVEGITEYLPISSTGHLILTKALLGLDGTPEAKRAVDDFVIVIQGGAILAVLGLYFPRVVQMCKGLMGKDPAGLKLVVNLFVAFIPAAIFGKLLDNWIESQLFYAGPVLFALAAGGIYMMIVERWRTGSFGLRRMHTRDKDITQLSPGDALLIGLLQCVAMWPGTSRSMMTITGGLFVGLRPKQAAEFSFLLGLPTLGAATLYKLYKNFSHAHKTGTPNLFEALGATSVVLGIVVAAISAAIAVKWLVGFLNKHGLTAFGWYRLVLSAVLFTLVGMGIVKIGEPKIIRDGTKEVPRIEFVEPPSSSKK